MTNRETRKEQYEDALFALLMDDMAQEDGEELLRLNEQLKQDPGAAVPEAVQRRCERVRRRTARWLGRLLLAAILGVLLFTAAFAFSEDMRVATLNAVLEVMDNRTRITFEEAPSGAGQADAANQADTASGLEYHYNIALEWIPAGFELEDGRDGNALGDAVSYFSPQDGLIEVSVTPCNAGLIYNLNTESCNEREIIIKDHSATLYTTNKEMLQK